MKKLLHIIATPREDISRTLKIARSFLDVFSERYPDCVIDTLDLFKENIPMMSAREVETKFQLMTDEEKVREDTGEWPLILDHINRFLSADAYVFSVPMWNFSVPYVFKKYIDAIVQPRYLFRYTESGPRGLVTNRKALVITSRGGDYSEGSPFHAYDMQEPYLRTVLNFIGITDVEFINAQPMDASGSDVREEKIREAVELAVGLAKAF